MRLYASRMGYKLNDQGLFSSRRDSNNCEGGRIICYTEQEIFDALNLQYKLIYYFKCLPIFNTFFLL